MSVNAMIVMEVGGEVWLAKVAAETLELQRPSVEMSTPPGSPMRRHTPGPVTYITLNGQLVEAVRTWPSWDAFYDEAGALIPRREQLPQTRLLIGPEKMGP